MPKLTREDVLKLAALSRLKLSEEELERFSVELPKILDYVAVLQSVDTKGLEPTYQLTGLKNVMRADEARDYQAKPAALLKLATVTEKNQYKVKRVL